MGISWIAIGAFFKKAWVWLKEYWQLPFLIAYTLIMWVFFRSKANNAIEILETTKDSYKKQIEAIDGAHKEEIAKRNAIIEEYTKIIEAIEKEYDLEKKALETKKKKEVKKLVEENIEDPKALAEMISEEFGFNYTGTE